MKYDTCQKELPKQFWIDTCIVEAEYIVTYKQRFHAAPEKKGIADQVV